MLSQKPPSCTSIHEMRCEHSNARHTETMTNDSTAPSLLPPDDDLDIIHTRRYETRVYRLNESEMLVRGAISDTKPPGLYVIDDPDELEIHQMQIEMKVKVPELEIIDAKAGFETHPHTSCPRILDHYKNLIGLNIARGFTHKVRELFGGPRGCTHITALLQAMAPAVVQATWSMAVRKRRDDGIAPGAVDKNRENMLAGNINTCHVWAEDGEHLRDVREGKPPEPPLQVTERLIQLGRKPEEWRVF